MSSKLILCAMFTFLVACASASTPTHSALPPPSPTRFVPAQASATFAPAAQAAASPTTLPTLMIVPTVQPLPTILPTPIALQPSPAAPASLARTITESKDFAQVVAATQEALARGGIGISDGDQVYVQSMQPAASITLVPLQTQNLALEARTRANTGTLTVARLGAILQELGWEFQKDSTPGEQLIQFFSIWIKGAEQEPNDSQSFTPLFLAEMAKWQTPAVNLTDGSASPDHVYLTLLELELFTAAFDRAAQKESFHPGAPRAYQVAFTQPNRNLTSLNHAFQSDPCGTLKRNLSGFTGQFAGVILKQTFAKALLSTIETIRGETDAKRFRKAYGAVAILNKLLNLVTLYRSINISVTIADDDTIHKGDQTEPLRIKQFNARVSVTDPNDAQAKRAKDALRNCFKLFGFPTPDSYEDVAANLDKWSVEWTMVSGFPEHAEINYDASAFDFKGQNQHWLKRVSETSGEATMFVNIMSEKASDHPGPEHTAQVVVKAELETSQMLQLDTLVNAMRGGAPNPLQIGSALADVVSGLIQEMAQPKAFATLNVTYHAPYDILVQGSSTLTYSGWLDPAYLYERGTVKSDFAIKLRSLGDQKLEGNGTGSVTYELDENLDPEAKKAGVKVKGNCTKQFSGKFEYIATGEIKANKDLLIMITTPNGNHVPGCLHEKWLGLSGRFTIPMQSGTHHFIVQEEHPTNELDNYAIYCGVWEPLCTVTATWDFTVTLLSEKQ